VARPGDVPSYSQSSRTCRFSDAFRRPQQLRVVASEVDCLSHRRRSTRCPGENPAAVLEVASPSSPRLRPKPWNANFLGVTAGTFCVNPSLREG